MLVLSKLPLLLGATATLLGTGECRQSKHSGSHTRIGGGDGVSATGAAGSSATGSPSSGGGSSGSCEAISDVAITFYGYPDNDPPSDETAYSCSSRGAHAGGTGSYDDPLSFATAPGEYNKCEIIYLPYLQKYLRFDDTCAQCSKPCAPFPSGSIPRPHIRQEETAACKGEGSTLPMHLEMRTEHSR